MNYNTEHTVTAQLVQTKQRMKFLPTHFGRHFMRGETMVFDWASRLSADYTGGSWHFYELSNGGFYMAPVSEPLHVFWDLNGFEGDVSADAFGVIVTLFALCHLAEITHDDDIGNKYHLVRDFTMTHNEAPAILRAID